MSQERDRVFMINRKEPSNLLEVNLFDDSSKELKISQTTIQSFTVDDNGSVYCLSPEGSIYHLSWDANKKAQLVSFKLKERRRV